MPYPSDDEDYDTLEHMLLEDKAHESRQPRPSAMLPTPQEKAAIQAELDSPLSPREYDAAYRETQWDDHDQEMNDPVRAGYQGIVDDYGPSMKPQPPDFTGEGSYAQGQFYDMDTPNGDAPWSVIPHEGPLAGERVSIPEGSDKYAIDSLAYDATYGKLGGGHKGAFALKHAWPEMSVDPGNLNDPDAPPLEIQEPLEFAPPGDPLLEVEPEPSYVPDPINPRRRRY